MVSRSRVDGSSTWTVFPLPRWFFTGGNTRSMFSFGPRLEPRWRRERCSTTATRRKVGRCEDLISSSSPTFHQKSSRIFPKYSGRARFECSTRDRKIGRGLCRDLCSPVRTKRNDRIRCPEIEIVALRKHRLENGDVFEVRGEESVQVFLVFEFVFVMRKHFSAGLFDDRVPTEDASSSEPAFDRDHDRLNLIGREMLDGRVPDDI